ncbi:hypothetical protein H4R99_007251 [Coemansia sp. RSA 1722]|nr:hypothetical protein IWW45_003821 [Coemansia sp. RSA 485]KAJ2590006.1 hypothetical protein H4R99_007251 [Coemansia sp. RSA 1722]KAJ2601331.1 hypothetical protein GGF39_001318 [Coemansia sp. RSA 1721]KAJ2638616.1 hypothetical protein GGF40_001526 [Coemansia sp. RSA 1286]
MKQTLNFHAFKQRKDTFLRRGRYRWPYIKYSAYLAQPDTLASAGFSFCPAKDAPDNVQCFHCGFELTGWEQSDDPFSEHYAHQPSCTYAKLHCQTREALAGNKVEWVGWPVGKGGDDMEQKARLLAMRSDVATRLETFTTNEWPHTGRVDWNVTPEKLAKAGFYYTPEWWGDDTATCQFCGYALAEWEADDDPNAEHERRVPDCLFFTLIKEQTAKLVSSPLPKGTPRRISMRTSMQAADISTLEPDQQDDTDGLSDSKRQRVSEILAESESENHGNGIKSEELDQSYSDGQVMDEDQEMDGPQDEATDSSAMVEQEHQSDVESDEAHGQEQHGEEANEDEEEEEMARHAPSDAEDDHGQYGDDDDASNDERMSLGSDGGQDTKAGVHLSPDVSVGADVDDDSDEELSTGQRSMTAEDQRGAGTNQSTQLSETQVPGSPVEMVVDEEYQQATQVEAAGHADGWNLTEDEESMTVEEFIRACCEQKVASLEASAAQMISSFTQRAEHTRERIYNMPW